MDTLSKDDFESVAAQWGQMRKGSKPGDSLVGDIDDHPNRIGIRAAELGRKHFQSGLYCAESVLKAMADIHGHNDPMISKIATGFCGGMSRTSGICGALAGGIMALGLFTGRSNPTDSKDQCFALVYCLVNRFREIFGSTQCTDLLGCDISTAEGARVFEEKKLMTTRCEVITSQTAGLVEEILARRDTIRHPLL